MNQDSDRTRLAAPPSAGMGVLSTAVASPRGVLAFSMLDIVRGAGVLLRRAIRALQNGRERRAAAPRRVTRKKRSASSKLTVLRNDPVDLE